MNKKTIHLKGRYVIRGPRQRIYDIITDFENVPKHFPSVAKSAKYRSQEGNRFVVEANTKAFFGSKTFAVRMEGVLNPPAGFTSVNTSSLGVEHEVFRMEEVPEGTVIHYINDVEIKSRFFRIFGNLLIKQFALSYWERVIFGKIREMLEEEGRHVH